ncbi:UNVERIFIED_CONTAM: putative protein phosphatase 2C 65 [Sesamum latifolium]|uniref:PPM-type phosphatase domain-containing protein n=1 Tax=Sesamum latifolium TaxID=2727402 RepID=A0AAW2XAH7_9LAMI
MGACCSCHTGGRFEYPVEEEDEEREVEHEDIILRGHAGARVRHQGSSKYVSMYTQQGRKGTNQDAMTVWESFSGDKDMFFCAVFDGHGPSGHKNAVLDIETGADDRNQNMESINPLLLSWKARLTKSFQEMDEQLGADGSVETYCSGTTSVCVLRKGEHLVIANLGDSRAVLCTRNDSQQLVSEQLTIDLKPHLPAEAKRITSCQGRIMAMEEEPNVYRIWMPNEDCPGLAMARAFGDYCLKDFGLISTPEVTYRKLTERDEFVVLATDGIWDALSNDEVVKIVASARKRSMAGKLLVEKAVRAWKYRFPRAKIDDCAVVVLFFKRQKPVLTKSASEVTELSFNFTELEAQSMAGRSDDALDTVLDCRIDGSPEDTKTGAGKSDPTLNRPRRRRPARKLEYVGE